MFFQAGLTDIAAAGTDVVIKDKTWKVKSVTFKAPSGNTGAVYLGVEGVAAASGYPIYPGEAETFNCGDGSVEMNSFWADTATNGNDIAWSGLFIP